MKINELIQERRKAMGISQKDLSEKADIRVATLSDFEKGKSGLNSNTLEKIMEILNLEIKSIS